MPLVALRRHDAMLLFGSTLVVMNFAGGERQDASPEERARLWALATQTYPGYDDYQARTSQEIPLVILTPAAARA